MTQHQDPKFTGPGIIILSWLFIRFLITCHDYFVLKTSCRIQGNCKKLNAEIIVSDDLINALQHAGKYSTQFS